MYIVMKNAQGFEIDRCQVFHNATPKEALIRFIENHEVEAGDKYEIVDNEND